MNAMQKALEYAKEHNKPGILDSLTDQQFVGQMAVEGVVIERTPNSKTVARMRREGHTIIVTEITITETNVMVGNRMTRGESESTREVFRANL